jgi:biopolymer transport protein TolR
MQRTLPRPLPHINVTPMIDVMLVLLIIFMVVVPVIAMQVDLPVAVHSPAKPEEPDEIVLIIDRDGARFLEVSGHAAPGIALREQLAALYGDRARDKILFLKADTALPFGVLEPALVDARAAGVRVIAAITERKVSAVPSP